MCFEALRWAIKQPVWNASERAVLAVLADYANKQGQAWPSVATIATLCGMSERGVRYTQRRLIERKLLSIRSIDGHRRYCLPIDEPEAATIADGADETPATIAVDAAIIAAATGNGCSQSSKEPIINQSGADAPSAGHDRKQDKRQDKGHDLTKRGLRATRLSEDWQPSDKDIAWAEREFPDVDWRREALLFRNYWLARGDAGAAKTDWPRTWQNWIANEAKFAARRKPMQRFGTPPPPPLREDDEPWQQRLAGFRSNGFWLRNWGPKPGEEGCRVPKEVISNDQ